MSNVRLLARKLEDLMRLESPKVSYPTSGRKLEPPLDEASLQGFEVRHQIRLPDDYRDFVLQVGNGGPGPGCEGLRKLDVNGLYGEIARPFPLTEGWCRDSEATLESEPDRWRQRIEWPGTIEIGCSGCTVWFHLVVSGETRGQIWLKDHCDHIAMWPDGEDCPCHLGEFDAGYIKEVKQGWRRFSFYSWYDKWLDESIERVTQNRQRTTGSS